MQALTFRNTKFDIIDRNGQPWLQAPQIAKALGYANEDAISRIYRRNADEFTPCMAETVKLTVSGNLQKEVRIFSLRGAHLLAMFARTQVAKEFRRWVLDVLDGISEVPAKTARRQKPQLGAIRYPLEAWMAACAFSRQQPKFINGHLEVGLGAVTGCGDTPSPTSELLSRLTAAGYDVSACHAEWRALRFYASSLQAMSDELVRLQCRHTSSLVL